MPLNVIHGIQDAENVLMRVDPLDLSSLPESVLERTRQAFGDDIAPEESILQIIRDVRQDGDAAVRRYAKLLDGADLDQFRIDEDQIARAKESVSPELRESLELAARRVRAFHESTMPNGWLDREQGLGELVRPLDRVGLYAPGGSAAYPSTVLMTAIPARVAGVGEVILTTPRLGSEPLNPAVIAAADIAGVDALYQVGGVPAIAAMAYGTESMPKVDKICGPGNVFVAYAKKLVQGQVDIDGVFGPTETIILADNSANASFCAADLIAQAEHDPLATAILITDSEDLVRRVEAQVELQLAAATRGEVARQALERQGRVVVTDSLDDAVDLVNRIAPEHVCLLMADPWSWVDRIKHAGGLFLGEYSPEVMGDYIAGPSHVMPTGGTARFGSALSVHHFLRTMPVVGLSSAEFQNLGPAAVHIANAEGLAGHAGAVQVRLDTLRGVEQQMEPEQAVDEGPGSAIVEDINLANEEGPGPTVVEDLNLADEEDSSPVNVEDLNLDADNDEESHPVNEEIPAPVVVQDLDSVNEENPAPVIVENLNPVNEELPAPVVVQDLDSINEERPTPVVVQELNPVNQEDLAPVVVQDLDSINGENPGPAVVESLNLANEAGPGPAAVEDLNPTDFEDKSPISGKGPGSWLRTKLPSRNRTRVPDEDQGS